MIQSERRWAGISFLLALSATPTGCAAYAKALGAEIPTLRSPNPLGGAALTVGGRPSADARSCDRPFNEDGFALSASPEQICIEEAVLFVQHPSLPPPSIESIERVLSGDAPKSVIALASQGPAANISRCSGLRGVGEATVWQQKFKGCVPNKGIILASTHLFGLVRDDGQVDHGRPVGGAADEGRFLRWEFGPGATATTAGPRPAGGTQSAPASPPEAAGDPATPSRSNAVGDQYKVDVAKCMRGEGGDSGMVGGGTCKQLRRAAQSGDTSQLPPGAAQAFREVRDGRQGK